MVRVLTGVLVIALLLINTLVLIGPMMVLALIRLTPIRAVRDACSRRVMWIAEDR